MPTFGARWASAASRGAAEVPPAAPLPSPTAPVLLRAAAADRLAWPVLVLILIAGGALLLYETRGTTLWSDEWIWALNRRGDDIGTYLRPHNGHFSLVPLAIYKLLFATSGLDNYTPYRVVSVAGQLICATLLFAYLRPRVGVFLGWIAVALLLGLGPGWQVSAWPFQIGWTISLATGLAALMALDRRDRAGDIAACVLLAVSLASSGIGLAVALGVFVEVAWGRRRWADAWIVVVPGVLYALWWLGYQDTQFNSVNIRNAPIFVADGLASSVSPLLGLSGGFSAGDTTLGWGRPLAVLAMALAAAHVARSGPVPTRILSLGTIMVAFWALTSLNRAYIGHAYESRYVYVGVFLTLLLTAQLLLGAKISRRAHVVVGVLAAVAVVHNIYVLRDAGAYLRGQAVAEEADLGVLHLARPVVKPGYVSVGFPGHPIISLPAAEYFAAADSLGTPAASQAQLAADPEIIRVSADAELARIHGVALRPQVAQAAGSGPPLVDAVTGGSAVVRGSCVSMRSTTNAASGGTLDLTLPAAGLVVSSRRGLAAVSVRRFAHGIQHQVGTVDPRRPSVLHIAADRGTVPWHVRVTPAAAAMVCRLG